jgi:PAS domain S-box-containing protein
MQFLDHFPGIIFSWQPDSGIDYINAALAEYLAYSLSELQENPDLLSNIIYPNDKNDIKQAVEQLLNAPDGNVKSLTVRCRHRRGHFVWFSLNLTAVRQGAGQLPQLYGTAQDVTDQQKTNHNLRLQANFFVNLPMPIFVTNLQGEIIFWNQGATDLFSYKAEKIWGQPLGTLLNISETTQTTLLDLMFDRGNLTQDIFMETATKEPLWVKLTGQRLNDQAGLPIGFLFTPMETTKQKVSDTLRDISAVLVSSLQLDETLTIILESLEKLLKFDSAAIYLLTPNNRLRMVSGRGMPYIEVTLASAKETEVFPLDEAVISNQRPLAIADVRQDERWTPLKGTEYIRSWLGVPLLFHNKPLGMVTVDRAAIDPFTQDQIALAEAFAGHAAIAIQNAELFDHIRAQQERLRRLASRVVTAQEDERRRISRELHDEMGQALTALKLNLQMLSAAVPPEEILFERLDELVTLANDSLQEVRRLAMDLRPSMLDDLGLVPTLRWYIEQFRKRSSCNVTLSIIDDLPRLTPKTETAFYRVVQEALTNVSRHAQADNVEVSLSMDGGYIQLSIIDDGRGFQADYENQRDALGVGLISMRERIDDLQGKFEILSGHQKGTHIQITVPGNIALNTTC